MATKVMKFGKFKIPKMTKAIELLDYKPSNYGQIIGSKGQLIGTYKMNERQKKQRRRLRDYINKIYDLNEDLLKSKDISKSEFKNQMYNIMYEDTVPNAKGEILARPLTVRKALRLLGRTNVFTTPKERMEENFKSAVRRDVQLKTELQAIFGGRIMWSKIQWVDAVYTYDSTGKKTSMVSQGYFKIDSSYGEDLKLQWQPVKKKEYRTSKVLRWMNE